MPCLVALTCASGRQSGTVIPYFYGNPDYKLRLIVNSPESQQRLQNKYPDAEVIRADLGYAKDCEKILDGVSSIYYVSPPFHPHEASYAFNVIDAAVAEAAKPNSKFAHFVLSSVIYPEITKLLNHLPKLQAQEYLAESQLNFTILQQGHFMENTAGSLIAQKDSPNPQCLVMHPLDIKFSFSCVRDNAEVTAKVIKEASEHYFATYQLVSTFPITYTEYAKGFSEGIGKKVETKRLPFEEAVNVASLHIHGPEASIDQRRRDAPERMFLYYQSRGVGASPRILEWLLGRRATTPKQLAEALLAETNKA